MSGTGYSQNHITRLQYLGFPKLSRMSMALPWILPCDGGDGSLDARIGSSLRPAMATMELMVALRLNMSEL